MHLIELERISKTFHISKRTEGMFSMFIRKHVEVRALDEISFAIGAGELVGYIGPNGAGKSTTVKVMSGILTPEQGRCLIMERVPWKERVEHVSQIGVVFGQRSQLWWDVPVLDSFELLKDIYNISKADYAQRLKELSDALDVEPLLKTPVRQLSLGQRIRCEIAAALLHRPKILFLDEPTIGLDAVSKLALRKFLKQENQQHGVTMILTTHDMNDIEALCERVMVIGHGKLLYDGGLAKLKSEYAPHRKIKAVLIDDNAQIKINGVEEIKLDGNVLTVLFDPTKLPAHQIVSEIADNASIADIIIEEQDIDEIIAQMYREMKL